jgi:hypothetical protein
MPRSAKRVMREFINSQIKEHNENSLIGFSPSINLANNASQLSEANAGENTMADETTTRKVALVTKKGKTRGKNPRDIEYQAFDLEQPDTLPNSPKEFMEVTGLKTDAELVSVLIDGFNQQAYSAASDEIGEFIEDSWDKETQAQFRLAVRNMSKLTGMSIDDTVAMLKPGVLKGVEAKKASAAPQTVNA